MANYKLLPGKVFHIVDPYLGAGTFLIVNNEKIRYNQFLTTVNLHTNAYETFKASIFKNNIEYRNRELEKFFKQFDITMMAKYKTDLITKRSKIPFRADEIDRTIYHGDLKFPSMEITNLITDSVSYFTDYHYVYKVGDRIVFGGLSENDVANATFFFKCAL